MPAKAFQPLDHVSRIADLAEFAVRDDRDAGLDLLGHGVVHRCLHDAVEFVRIIRIAMIACQQQWRQLRPPWQAPHMCDIYARHDFSSPFRSLAESVWQRP